MTNKLLSTLFVIVAMAFTLPSFAQTPSHFIPADDANIQYVGRIDFSNPLAPAYTYPGVSISAKFNGTAITADFKDYAFGGATSTNYYNIYVDNVFVKSLKMYSNTTNYPLVSGLPAGAHSIRITKRTESSVGKSSFKGFYIEESALLTPDVLPTRKIEFIGDSWTCGYGDEYSGAGANTGFTSVNENNDAAWGAITSRRLNAQYHCTAYSGRGLYRNNDGNTASVLPNIFNRIFPDDANSTWNHSSYIPDVVVVHLGTNDFANEQTWANNHSVLDSTAYVQKYIGFISDLRNDYGVNTKIICVNGSSISIWNDFNQFNRWNNYMTAIFQHFANLNDHNVFKFNLVTQAAPYGEDWHPAKHEHIKMANQITPYIQNITAWQDCANVTSGTAYLDDCAVCVAGTSGNVACVPGVLTSQEIVANTSTLKIYPNPAASQFAIEGVSEQIQWTIYNTLGESVAIGQGKKANVELLANGLYHLVLYSAQQQSLSFLKE